MRKAKRVSEYMYNYSDIKERHDPIRFTTEKKTAHPKVTKTRSRYASGVTCEKLQTVWKAHMPLCRRKRSRSLLPFCQHVWAKPYHDLCVSQKSRQSQKSFGQLSKCPKDLGRNQHDQSRSISEKGNIVEKKLCSSKWKPPP